MSLERDDRPGRLPRMLGLGAAVSVAYVLSAWLGFRFAVVAEQVTTVWAPSGIGLAALLIFGRQYWPAIFLGALVANAATNAPIWTAALIAAGNTLEAVVGANALRRTPRFDRRLRRVRSVAAFGAVSLLAPIVSATIGVATLCASGVQPWPRFADLWQSWWLGDAIGVLIVGPVLLTIQGPWTRRLLIETAALVGAAILATQLVFGPLPGTPGTHHPLEYVIFPFVIAAALRGGQPATSLVVLAASIVTVLNTAGGAGPFAESGARDSLLLLQVFMGVLAGTGLVLAAAMKERETGERRRMAAARVANQAKDQFLATLSHELRTPLNAILGWTRIMLDGNPDEQGRKHALEVIERNALLQAQLVSDILDVSRIISGGMRLETRRVDLGAVVDATIAAIRPAAEARHVSLRSQLPATGCIVHGDEKRLQQVIWNLLSNALKFAARNGQVAVTVVELDAGAVRLSVSDNGVGIDPEFLPFVFDRFRQADGSAGRQHGGLGLGLAIVRHLVELHGGTVRAESAGPGKGATFTVELPRAAIAVERSSAAAARAAAPAPFSSTALAGCRLLVVDDQEDARVLMEMVLAKAGAEVVTAESTADALSRLTATDFDALLTDIGMPGPDGYALIEEVRRRDAAAGTYLPAAAVTAYASPRDRDRALAAGFDLHITKPIDLPALVADVASLCPRRRPRRRLA